MRLGKTAIIHFFSQVGTSLVGFVTTLYFARVLGADTLGKYFVAVAMVAWLMIPADGFTSAIRKRVSEKANPGPFFTSGILFNIVISVGVILTILVLKSYVNDYVGAEVATIVALLFGGNVLYFSVTNGLKGQKKVAQAGLLKTFVRILRAVFQVALVYLSYELSALIIGHILAIFVASAVGLWLYTLRPKIPNSDQLRSIVDYAKYSWLGGFRRKSFNWLDVLVLNFLVASSLVGVYEISWNIASILTLISSSIQNALFPEISDISADEEFSKVRDLFNDGMAFAGIFIIPGFFGALIVGEEILRIYGAEFTQGYYILLVLIVARGVAVYEGMFLQTLNAINKPNLTFKMNVVFVVINLILNVVLIYQFGWIGAAIATTMSSGLSLGLGYYFFTNTQLGSPVIPWGVIGKQIFSGVMMAVLVWGLRNTVPWNNRLVTVALVFLGAAIYMVILMSVSKRVRTKMFSLIPS